MTTFEQLHKPRWQPDSDNWLMIRTAITRLPRSSRIPTTYSRSINGSRLFLPRALSTITAGVPWTLHRWSSGNTISSNGGIMPAAASAIIHGCIAPGRIAAAAARNARAGAKRK